MRKNKLPSSETRSVAVSGIRAVEGDDRRFRISFSSEQPYMRCFGNEILSHAEGAVDLSRLNEIGVVLFNHDTDKVIGRIDRAWIENQRGEAEIVFDTDEDSEKILRKVKSGTLRGVSVQYSVEEWEEIKIGKKSDDGFDGPCYIARKWTALEVSIVSVPADATVGVEREYTAPEKVVSRGLDAYEAQIIANKNFSKRR